MTMLLGNKEEGYNYRERRHEDWRENYSLYRDKVQVNRLNQRQSVNIPLMKKTVRTLLKDVDDMPVLFFENLDNDKEKEVFQNEYWKWTSERNNMELKDIVDKKQVFLFGRSFDQWQIVDGQIKMTIIDPMDMLVSRFVDPTDLNTSRYLIHNHIFVPFSNLEKNKDYDQKEVRKLKKWYMSDDGLVKVTSNRKMYQDKIEKMSDMGLDDVDSPEMGETYVELSLHFIYLGDGEEEQLYLIVEADDQVILMKKPLDEIMGKTKDNYWKNHYPYNSWADDLERQDFWSDAIADTTRTPNKILNSNFSQLIENRTLRNFGMTFYDSTGIQDTFQPNTFNPVPFGFYGIPGNPNEILKRVEIPDLSESLDEMQFVIEVAESASGATATQQGNIQSKEVTLGEVQLALGEAKERIKGMSKFYTKAWHQRGEIFLKLIEGNPQKLDAVKIYKQGRNSNDIFEREIESVDYMSKSGYQTKVWSQEDKKSQDSDMLQKLNATATLIPGNPKLIEIYQRKLLEFAGLSPDEINAVMEFEQVKMGQPQVDEMGNPVVAQPGVPTAPGVNLPDLSTLGVNNGQLNG